MLGIPMPDNAHSRLVSCKNAIHTLCIEKN